MRQPVHIVALVGLLAAVVVPAFSRDAAELYPEYRIETITEAEKAPDARSGDALLPFIHNGYLYTFSLERKRPLWRIFIGADLVNPFVVSDGILYVYDIYNRLYSIDMAGRSILWKADLKDEIRGKPCVYGRYVAVATQRGNLVLLSTARGGLLHEHEGEAGIAGGLALYGNLAIVPYKNGRITAIDLETKREQWSFNAGGVVSVSPVVTGGSVYFGAWDETFYALDASSGELGWASYVGEDVLRDFIAFEELIVLFFSKGEILCLDAASGEIRWVRYFDDVEFNFNYFRGVGKFFVFTPDCLALDARRGEVLFRYRERAYYLYKEMLFENMIEGEHALSEEDRSDLLAGTYYTVSAYPIMPPVKGAEDLVSFVTEDSFFYAYDIREDFFVMKYKLK